MSRAFKALLVLLLPSLAWGALSKTYPTSPVTVIRLSAYEDSFATIYKSTDTIDVETWEGIGSTWTWINKSAVVSGFVSVWDAQLSTYTVKSASWTIQQYTDLINQEIRQRAINEILEEGIEQYMVFPTTGPCPLGWKGWRQGIVNGQLIPVACQ